MSSSKYGRGGCVQLKVGSGVGMSSSKYGQGWACLAQYIVRGGCV